MSRQNNPPNTVREKRYVCKDGNEIIGYATFDGVEPTAKQLKTVKDFLLSWKKARTNVKETRPAND